MTTDPLHFPRALYYSAVFLNIYYHIQGALIALRYSTDHHDQFWPQFQRWRESLNSHVIRIYSSGEFPRTLLQPSLRVGWIYLKIYWGQHWSEDVSSIIPIYPGIALNYTILSALLRFRICFRVFFTSAIRPYPRLTVEWGNERASERPRPVPFRGIAKTQLKTRRTKCCYKIRCFFTAFPCCLLVAVCLLAECFSVGDDDYDGETEAEADRDTSRPKSTTATHIEWVQKLIFWTFGMWICTIPQEK